MIDDLPWARGNPQPKSGKRGTASWNQGQRIAQIPASIYTVGFIYLLHIFCCEFHFFLTCTES